MSVNSTEMKQASYPYICSHLTVPASPSFPSRCLPCVAGRPLAAMRHDNRTACAPHLHNSHVLEAPPEGNVKHLITSLTLSCGDKGKEGEYHKRTVSHWRIGTLHACWKTCSYCRKRAWTRWTGICFLFIILFGYTTDCLSLVSRAALILANVWRGKHLLQWVRSEMSETRMQQTVCE